MAYVPVSQRNKGYVPVTERGSTITPEAPKLPFDATKTGIAVNTVLGLPKAAKEVFLPTRGYTEQQLKKSKPTVKETLLALPKTIAEIPSALGELGGYIPVAQRFSQTKTGGVLANVGQKISEFAQPKTAGEAKSMRVADVAGLFPAGSLKNVGTSAKIIAKTDDVVKITKELKGLGLTDNMLETTAKQLKTVTDPVEVSRVIAETQKLKNPIIETGKPLFSKTPITKIKPIEDIKPENQLFLDQVNNIKSGKINEAVIGKLPVEIAQKEQIGQDIIFNRRIGEKIAKDHGVLPAENLVITANNPTTITRFKDALGKEKINLIKELPDGSGLVISAEKQNGHFIVTFFEPKDKAYLASIKKRGRPIFDVGGTAVPSSATPSLEVAGQPGLSGVKSVELSIGKEGENVKKMVFPKSRAVQATPDQLEIKPNLSFNTEVRPHAGRYPEPQVNMGQKVGQSTVGIGRKSDQLLEANKIATEEHIMAKDTNALVANKVLPNKGYPLIKSYTPKLKESITSLIEKFQDSQVRVRQLLSKKDLKISDISDTYLKSTLYHGKVQAKIDAVKDETKSIIFDLKKEGLTRQDISDYLIARHAPERNVALGEKAAGITTAEAKTKLLALESSPKGSKIKEIADKVQNINNQTLDVLKEGGVISEDLYKTLREKYKHHVPLNRLFEDTEDFGQVLSNKGFDVRSTGIKKAKGSEREVSDIMTNVIANYEQAVLRAEKNIVDQATLTFARQNADILGDLIQVKKPLMIGRDFKGLPLMERTNDPSVLQMFENGKRIWIKINDLKLAVALRGIGREKLPGILQKVGALTRFFAGLATRFNPEFALPNKIRDLQETIVYLASQKEVGFKGAAKMATRDLKQKNTMAVLDALRGKETEGAKLYHEMRSMGGTTGGMSLSTRDKVEINLESLEKLANSKTRRVWDNFVEYVDNWNTIFEDSTRLGVYRQALEQGLSKDRAAFLAKEASINFNRIGTYGPIVNALYMFSNASIQGTAKMLRALKNPKVLGATVLAVGGSVAAINEWNDQVDSGWRDKVSKWDRLNGLPVMIPSTEGGAKYITIPVSWGLKPIKVMADYAYDSATGENTEIKEILSNTISSVMEAYNPVGGTDLSSAITPSVLDIINDINRNKSWSGNTIYPNYDPNAPADIKYFSSLKDTFTGETAISLTELLNGKTGIAISPAVVKYAYDQIVGGAGRTVSKTVNLITGLAQGKLPDVDEYPLISRFYRQRTEEEIGRGAGGNTEEIKNTLQQQSRERFQIKNEAKQKYQELKELSKTNKDAANEQFEKIKVENPELADKIWEIGQDEKKGLTYQDKLIKQLGVENGERAKYIWSEVNKLKTREEKNAYIDDLRGKGLISDGVYGQLVQLKEMADLPKLPKIGI